MRVHWLHHDIMRGHVTIVVCKLGSMLVVKITGFLGTEVSGIVKTRHSTLAKLTGRAHWQVMGGLTLDQAHWTRDTCASKRLRSP